MPKEVRGIMFGAFFASAQFGRFIFYKIGSLLFKMANYWPMFFLGISWISLSMITATLFVLGFYEKRADKALRSTIVNSMLEKS